jgi:hypothetical protein
MQNSWMHHARPWAKEQPAWGDKVPNWHITPKMRDSRDLREKRDWAEVLSSRVAPVAHVLLVSLMPQPRG